MSSSQGPGGHGSSFPSHKARDAVRGWSASKPSALLPDRLHVGLEAGAAGAAEAGVILVAAELGLQDQATVGQLGLVDAVPAGVPGLGRGLCKTTAGDVRRKVLSEQHHPDPQVQGKKLAPWAPTHHVCQLHQGHNFPTSLAWPQQVVGLPLVLCMVSAQCRHPGTSQLQS